MRDTIPTSEPPAPCSNLAAAAIRNGVAYADVEAYRQAEEERRAQSVLEAVIACGSVMVARMWWHGELT